MKEKRGRKGSLIQGDHKRSLSPWMFKRHLFPIPMRVSRWSNLGAFGPVWLCLIEVEKESCCTRNQKQEQQKTKENQERKKENKRRGVVNVGRCEIYRAS